MDKIIPALVIVGVILVFCYVYKNYISEGYHTWGRCLRCGRHKRWHGAGLVCMCGCENYDIGPHVDPYTKTGYSNTLARKYGNQNSAQSTHFTSNPCVGTWDCWVANNKMLTPGINYNHTHSRAHVIHKPQTVF